MELNKYKEASKEYTAQASSIVRQLGLAGIGIIWIFKGDEGKLDVFLAWPLFFLSFSLLFDLLQYVFGVKFG